MLEEIVIAGFGGQGVMVAGQLLAQAGMLEGKQVAWIPSYGPEMRGGTANCTVIISDEEIGSPIAPHPGVALALNGPSLDKYEPLVKPNGLLIVNSSLATREVARGDLRVIHVAANDEAAALGNPRLANAVMLGALIGATELLPLDRLEEATREVLSSKEALIDLNRRALRRGYELAAGATGALS